MNSAASLLIFGSFKSTVLGVITGSSKRHSMASRNVCVRARCPGYHSPSKSWSWSASVSALSFCFPACAFLPKWKLVPMSGTTVHAVSRYLGGSLGCRHRMLTLSPMLYLSSIRAAVWLTRLADPCPKIANPVASPSCSSEPGSLKRTSTIRDCDFGVSLCPCSYSS